MAACHQQSPFRHRRVWLSCTLAGDEVFCRDPHASKAILQWAEAGNPFIGRARAAEDPVGSVPLGLALARSNCRIRLSFTVQQRSVDKVAQPIELAELLPTLPDRMRETALRLVSSASQTGTFLGVYGSVFWERFGGGYLHPDSDLDILARPLSARALQHTIQELHAIDATSPMRVDGEIEFPSGAAVAWRELASNSARVLVKTDTGPVMRSRASILSEFPAAPDLC